MTRVKTNLTVMAWCLTVAFLALVVVWPMAHRSESKAAGPVVIRTSSDDGVAQVTVDSPDVSGLPVMYPAPAFKLTNQLGKPFGNDDLRGHPYIIDFIYTTCQTACPKMSADVQDLVGKVPPDVRFVSFTVDPDTDDVKALNEYAKFYGADPSRWIFLTGTKDAIYQEEAGMKVLSLAAPGNPLMHSEKFFLVDGLGQVRLLAESYDAHDVKRLIDGAEALSTNTPATQPGDAAGMVQSAPPATAVVQSPPSAGATP
jgi:protein SCO1/2